MTSYPLVIQVTDAKPGWRLHNRVVPCGFTVTVQKYFRVQDEDMGMVAVEELQDHEAAGVERGTYEEAEYLLKAGEPRGVGSGWVLGVRDWLFLDVASSETQPPCCTALRAPRGIGSAELRFPLAGILATATARMSSKDGSFRDGPVGIEFEDYVFEANRTRKHRRSRSPVTTERLAEVAKIAQSQPHKQTAAVQHHFGVSRAYAQRLIKRAKAEQLF